VICFFFFIQANTLFKNIVDLSRDKRMNAL
jgi:hypothetical protein